MFSVLKNLFRQTISQVESFVHEYTTSNMRYFPNEYETSKLNSSVDADFINALIKPYVKSVITNVKPNAGSVDGGLYVGASGIAFMLYYLDKNLKNDEYLKLAVDYIKAGLKHPDADRTSFLLGDAGTQALAAVIYNRLGDMERAAKHLKNYQSLHHFYLDPNFLTCGGDELFVGRAGYIAGALWLGRELGYKALPTEDLHQICDVIVSSGKEYARKQRSPCPLMYAYYRTEYLGAAHGISFILQMLITVPGYLSSNPSAAADIIKSINFLVCLQSEDGNWPCTMDEVGQAEHKLVHWCHGSPGVVYLMAKAYLLFRDEKYLNSCIKAAEVVWHKGLLRKGPGICHGVAGSGYVFLLMYRLTKDEKYLNRANAFAHFLQSSVFKSEARVPDCPYSLYEGVSGTVCFLTDLLNPLQAEFPFQDVFTTYENVK